jgi:SAM-dependent methyltransferase
MSNQAGQHAQWSATFAGREDFLGAGPSEVGRAALERFRAAGVDDLLELGPGQGRDTLLFARAGLRVTAIDYAAPGLEQITQKREAAGIETSIRTLEADVRRPLPVADESFDACYAHMLLCMALSTAEIERLVAEVRRTLRPGGLFVYTVRHTGDPHYRAGSAHGDERYEMGGFVVHFFDRTLVERLADGWKLIEVAEYEEGRLPRRLFAVTLRKPLGVNADRAQGRADDRPSTASG